MLLFLLFVSVGALTLTYILYCVTRECWVSRRKTGVVETIPPANPVSIDKARRSHNPRSRHTA